MSSKKYHEFTAGTPDGNDLLLFGNPSTGALEKVTVDNFNANVGIMRRVKITKTYADFAIAATTNDIALTTLPAGAVVHGVITNVTTPFVLGNYNISIGIQGDSIYFKPNNDCLYAGDGAPNGDLIVASFTSSTVVRAFASSNSLLNGASAGAISIYIYYSVLN
jgi:hypothetical protein